MIFLFLNPLQPFWKPSMHVKGKVRQLLYLFKVFISPNIRQISPKSLKVGKQYLILTQNLGQRNQIPHSSRGCFQLRGNFVCVSGMRFPTCMAGHLYKMVCCCHSSNSTLSCSQPGAIHYQAIEIQVYGLLS